MVGKSSTRLMIIWCLGSGVVLGIVVWISAGRPPEFSFVGAIGGALTAILVMLLWRDKLFTKDP